MTKQPKLRGIQPNLIQYEGNPYVILNDPLRLAEETVLIPQKLAPLLTLCDGTRDISALRTGFELRTGIPLSGAILEQIISRLDEALLLDNERFTQARYVALKEYRNAPGRPPALAGRGYPANSDELKNMLSGYLDATTEDHCKKGTSSTRIRGLISPHIDFQRGGILYAQVWYEAAETIKDVDLAIILGTDHLGGHSPFTLTKQNYSTPWGTLPTAGEIVDHIAYTIGDNIAFHDELHHKSEHSIELALIWLHYFLGERECKLVPVLCGSFDRFITDEVGPSRDESITKAIDCLHEATEGHRTLVIAAADLAHMGPAFGDSYPIDLIERAKIKAADDNLLKVMCSADAEGFFDQIKQEGDARRICGLAPIYITLRFLTETRGNVSGYMQCPADATGTSLVSICGLVLE